MTDETKHEAGCSCLACEREYDAMRDALWEERNRENMNVEFAAADKRQREQTAATILAALIQAHDGNVSASTAMSLASDAVNVADALRAELAKAAP